MCFYLFKFIKSSHCNTLLDVSVYSLAIFSRWTVISKLTKVDSNLANEDESQLIKVGMIV